MEVAESLNIQLDNLDFSGMYPEVNSGMYPEVKENKLDFSRMDPEVKEENLTLTRIDFDVKVKKVELVPRVSQTNEGIVEKTKIERKPNESLVENNRVTASTLAETSETSISGVESSGDRITVHNRKSKTKTLPYKCDVCGHEFNQKGNMKTHKINKHHYQPPKVNLNRVKIDNKEPFLSNSSNIHLRYESVNQAFENVVNEGVKKSSFDLIKVRDPVKGVFHPPTQKVEFPNVHSKVRSLQKTFRTGSITISVDKDDTDQKSDDDKYFDKICSLKTKPPLNIVKGLTVTNPNFDVHKNVSAESESVSKSKPTNIEIVINKRTHKKSHNKLICSDCGKIFNDNSKLREHSLTHSDIRPFICDICGKGFTRLVLLNSHSSNTHSKK